MVRGVGRRWARRSSHVDAPRADGPEPRPKRELLARVEPKSPACRTAAASPGRGLVIAVHRAWCYTRAVRRERDILRGPATPGRTPTHSRTSDLHRVPVCRIPVSQRRWSPPPPTEPRTRTPVRLTPQPVVPAPVTTYAMTAATVPGLDQAPTRHRRLREWVCEVAELTRPDQVVWCDGSSVDWQRLTRQLVGAGTFVRLAEDAKPNS